MAASTSLVPAEAGAHRDAVAAAALTVVRRALVEGTPVTHEGLVRETSVALDATSDDAVRELDAVAQRLGVSSLS